MNDSTVIECLKTIWDFFVLNQEFPKCDLIIGCGCLNKDIPKRCSELYFKGYGKKILFTGGYGKVSKDFLTKSEAELYKDTAVLLGVDPKNIILEDKSTNTGDNFIFSKKILEEKKIKAESILIVHSKMYELRTLLTAKKVFSDKELYVTSPEISFLEYLNYIKSKGEDYFKTVVSVLVGNIQRIIVYPSLGFSEYVEVPCEIIKAYYLLKELGFTSEIYTVEQIKKLAVSKGIALDKVNYFN